VVSAGYFRTLGIPLTAGRDFTDNDRAGAPAVAIVNEEFVKHYWPGQPAVGRHFGVTWARDVEIVGVVKTARYRTVREAPQITIYIPVLQKPIYPLTLHARTRANPEFAIAQIRNVIRAIDPKLPVTAATLLDLRDVTISRERLLAFLAGFLAFLAAALVAIGLYGLIAYSVAGRTKEIGVRLALGARPTAVTWMFVRQALLMAALGIVIGLPPALACARFLKRIVFGMPPQDPIAAIAGCVTLGLIAAAAALWPAGKGARQDPMKALRYE
jgi:putative ABC transport system permease protein